MNEALIKFEEEFKHFMSKLNLGDSALDARAITFMNEVGYYLNAIRTEGELKSRLK